MLTDQPSGVTWPPFTTLTARQVRAAEFQPRDKAALPRTLAYLDELEAQGRYTLMVWPVHCQIGSWGHAVHASVQAACSRWEDQHRRPVQAVFKGANPWTEHYSAVQAEVPDSSDPDTSLNRALLARLDAADHILVAGEAASHCVKATVEHLVVHLPNGRPERITLLTDRINAEGQALFAKMGFFKSQMILLRLPLTQDAATLQKS